MAALMGVAFITTLHAQSSAFTYQGQLADNGSPANGFYDLTFSVWTNSAGPAQVGDTITNLAVPVSDGLFTVTLDFGPGVFDGSERWLEIGVATNGGGVFPSLSARQPITSTPYAIKAGSVDASAISGTLPLAQLPATVVTNEASNVNLSGSFSGDAGGLTNLDSSRLIGPLTVLGGGLLNIGQINDGSQARSVAVAGDYAYLADNDDGLRIYDISDPTNPLSIAHTNNAPNSRGVAVSGNYVYLASLFDGLRIYDVSDPTNPINIGHTNDGGGAWSVVVSGDYAYLADTADGLQVFDVSNPADPQLVGGATNGAPARDVVLSGNYAYVAGHSAGLFVYDISDPTHPMGIGQTNNGGQALGVAVSGDYLYLANSSDGLRVYDVSNPANPENIGHIAAAGIAESVVVADGYAYMAEHGDLRAYDVRDPANPVEVASFDTTFCLDVALAGNYLYLANGFDGLYVFDVTVARATSFGGHFLGDGGGLTNLHLNSLEAADGNPSQAVYVDNVGNVGIGTTAPEDLLHIYGGTGGPAHIRARMIIEDDDTAYLQFVTPSTAERGLLFSDEATPTRGGLIFNTASTPHGLEFRTGGITTPRMVLTSAGDVGIGTADPTNKLDVVGDVSATTFITTSDRNMKENLRPVVPEEILARVAALPIHQWNFKADSDTIHLGPMAQDFYAAFRVGPDDKHIATVDADGVALAAIQGLNQKVESGEQKAALRSQRSEVRIHKLEVENAELKARLQEIEQLLNHKLNGGAG